MAPARQHLGAAPRVPPLDEFRIRGVGGLTFGKLKHPNLTSFAIESGGLPKQLLREVCAADLPKLEHLELWLGAGNYGGIDDPAPLKPLLAGERFKKLKYLGLRNCEIANAVAQAVADSPIVRRLKVLDLSMGTLGDAGAEALLRSPEIRKLKKLDLHHHFISAPFVKELEKLPLTVDVADAKEPQFYTYDDQTDVYRYIVASE